MNDKYRPNNIVVPITHMPIKQVKDNVHIYIVHDGQVETNTHNNYDSEIVYDEEVETNNHNSYASDIMYEDEGDFIKSRFINYEVMIPISASTDISTEDQLTACSNSNEEKQEDLQENVSVNIDDKTSEPDVDLSFLDEIDVDLIITYLKEVALVEKNKETLPERSLLEKSIKRKPKYVPPSKRKNVKTNLDKDNSTKNNKHSTKKEPKYVPPSKRKNLKTNDTRSKTNYTKEGVIKLLKHVRQQYEAEAKVSKIQPNYAGAVKTSITSRNEIRVTKDNKLQRHIHQGAKHRHVNKRTDMLENKKSLEIRIENNCDNKIKITKNKHLKSKENFVKAGNTHLQYDSVIKTKLSASQASTSSKYRETKHERIVEIIDEKSRNKESNIPRSSNNNYANANLNPSSSRGKVVKAKERLKQYMKVKTLKEKYEGLQDKSNIQTKYYLTNVENLKQSTGDVNKRYKKHASFNEQTKKIVPNMKGRNKNRDESSKQNVLKSLCNTKLIESKFDNKANQNKPKANTDITINDSYKISSEELIELLSQIKTPNQISLNCSNQQIQSNLSDKQISNCIKTNGGKRETLSEETRVETYISKQDHTTGTLACTQMILTKSQNKKVCDEDTHNKTIYKSVSSIYKQNSTVQQTNELRKKSQPKTALMNTIYYLNGKPGDRDKTENVAQILIEQHNNENIKAIKKQMPTSYDQKENNIKSQGGNEIPLMCDQNMNKKSTNANHYIENTSKIMEENPKFKSQKHDKTRSVNDYSIHPTNTKLSNIKTNNNNTQILANKTNMKRKNEDNIIIKENYVKQKVYIISSVEKLEENMMPNEKAIFEQQNENLKTSKKHDAIKHSVMQNVHIKSLNENLQQNMMPIEKDKLEKHNRSIFTNSTDQKRETLAFVKEMETLVLQDIRDKTKHARNTEPKSSAGVRTGDKGNRGKLLEKDPKSSDIQSNNQKDNNIQSAEHINRIKEIQPKLEDQRKETKLTFAENIKLDDKSKGFAEQSNIKSRNKNLSNKPKNYKANLQIVNASEQRSESITSIQNNNIKTLNEEAKNYNKTKCYANQLNVKPNNENKHGISEQIITNSNANQQKINIEAEVKQQCSKSGNISYTYEKKLTLASSEKINTNCIDNHKYQKNKNNENVHKTNELNTKIEKLKPHDKNIDCKDRKHKNLQNKNNAGTLVKVSIVKSNNATQSANKIIEQNQKDNVRTLVKEPTAKTNNVAQSATKIKEQNKNNAGTLVKELTATTNNMTQSATKIIEQTLNNAGTLVKELTAKTNNMTQSATKIIEQTLNNAGTFVKEPTAKTNNVTQSSNKTNEQNKNNNAGTLLKEPTSKTNNVTQSATKTNEQNKNNNAGTLLKEPTAKTNNVTQSATKINEQNKNTLVKEPTAKTNNMTQSTTKIIEQTLNNAGTLVKELTAKTNNMTQSATKIIEQTLNNAGTLVKEPTAKTNNVTQSSTKTNEQNKNNNAGTLLKEPTAKTNNVTQSATKINEQNKNTLVKEPTAKTNNMTQSTTKIIEQSLNNAGTLVKELTAKTNNMTQSATKIIEQTLNNAGTLVKEPTAKTNNVTQSATKTNEQNKNNNAGTLAKELTAKTNNVTQIATKINEQNKNTLVKEPTAKTNNVMQSATKIIEQNKSNTAGTSVKEPTAKTNTVTQSATKINEQNKNSDAGTLVKVLTALTNVTQSLTKIIEQSKNNNAHNEPTANINNVTQSATKTIEQNKKNNAGTLVKEPTAKTNNVTQIATKTIEQNKKNNAGTLVKEPTARTNNVTQIATKINEQNKNNNARTFVKEPTVKTNIVTQIATKINKQNKNTLVKEPTAKTNNVMQSTTEINEQNTELKVDKGEKSTKTILNVNGKNETKISTKSNNDKYKEKSKINDKVSTNVARTSDSINARSQIETSILRDNCKSNNQESTTQINTKKTDSKKPNEDQTSKKPLNKTDSIKNTPYNPLKQSIVSSYFRVANKLNKNYNSCSHIAQDAIELNISVQMGIYCKVSVIHDGWWSRIYKLHINNTSDYMVLKQMRARFNNYPNKGYEKECFLKDFQASCSLQEVSNLLKVFNGFHFNGTWCHLMEYYPLNLSEALWSDCDGGLNICQIIHLSKQLIGAVNTLKKHRIIHSDIHPNHILTNSSLTTLKLCGFDNAHYEEDSIHYRYLATAKSYRAPEIILQTSEIYSIDVWAAACVLFEITTKRPLFKCSLDTFAQQMSLLFNWNQETDTDFDRRCRVHNKKFSNYEGPQATVSQRDITSYMIEGYKQVHAYTIPPKDQARLRKLGAIVTKMLVLNPRKRIPIEIAFFKILSIT